MVIVDIAGSWSIWCGDRSGVVVVKVAQSVEVEVAACCRGGRVVDEVAQLSSRWCGGRRCGRFRRSPVVVEVVWGSKWRARC